MGRRRQQRSAKSKPGPGVVCVSCGAAVAGRHCAECGELRADLRHVGLAPMLFDVFASMTQADGKVFRTLAALLARPGELTARFLAGARKPYMGPVQLFFGVNLVYFLLQSWMDWSALSTPFRVHTGQMGYRNIARRHAAHFAADHGVDLGALERSFDAVVENYSKSLVLLQVLFFALLIQAVLTPRTKRLVASLVFSLHFHAVLLLAMGFLCLPIGTLLASGRVGFVEPETTDGALSLLLLAGVAAYSASALRRAFGFGRAATAWRTAVLVAFFILAAALYRGSLFWIVLHTMPLGGG